MFTTIGTEHNDNSARYIPFLRLLCIKKEQIDMLNFLDTLDARAWKPQECSIYLPHLYGETHSSL
jgi:hypothetical protein